MVGERGLEWSQMDDYRDAFPAAANLKTFPQGSKGPKNWALRFRIAVM